MELIFRSDTKQRKWRLVQGHFRHPAKMIMPLQLWIYENFTRPGDWVLDPMAGSGTALVGASLGRNVICIELEQKYINMMTGFECDGKTDSKLEQLPDGGWKEVVIPAQCGEDKDHKPHWVKGNWERIQEVGPEMGYTMGQAIIMQGDARNMEHILSDVIISSPPFAGNTGGLRSAKDFHYGDDPVGERMMGGIKGGTGSHPDNIDRLPYGTDVIAFSPPYSDMSHSQGDSKMQRDIIAKKHTWAGQEYSDNPSNIGNLPHGDIDAIISSPPFFNTNIKKRFKSRSELEEFARKTKLYKEGRSLEAICRMIEKNWDEGQAIQADAIISSPPYSGTGVGDWSTPRKEFQAWVENELQTKGYVEWQGKRYTEKQWRAMNYGRLDGRTTKGVHKQPTNGYGKDTEGQIGNLPHGDIDAIVSSPPYEEAMGKKHHSPRADKLVEEKRSPTTYTDKVDTIISSPPYEGSLEGTSRHTKGGIASRDKKLAQTGTYSTLDNEAKRRISSGFQSEEALKILKSSPRGYSGAEDNIGNLKSDTYLKAMFQVYQQCYKVLKPQGLMILVIKNFTREKQEVFLDADTIRLCETAGFYLIDRHYRKLTQQSFWRVIGQQKCDHRRGSKQNPKCKMGLQCPIKQTPETKALFKDLKIESTQDIVEKLCPHYTNSTPVIDREHILVFMKG